MDFGDFAERSSTPTLDRDHVAVETQSGAQINSSGQTHDGEVNSPTRQDPQNDGFSVNLFNLVSSLAPTVPNSAPMSPLTWTQPISVEQTKAKFIEQHQSPQSPQSSKKRSGGGRPRLPESKLKRPRTDPRSKPTKLRARRPVNADIPSDVWTTVFHFTEYKTLLNLRLTCREFYYTTSREGFWMRYLEAHAHVPGMERELPQLPPGLSYMQYADLLLGQGCMGCGAMKTKKVQWAFFRRWCKTCFAEKTITGHEAQSITRQHGPLLDCIPTAVIDMWKNYSKPSIRSETRNGAHVTQVGMPIRRLDLKYISVTKNDLTNIVNEYESHAKSLPADMSSDAKAEELQSWRDNKKEAAQTELMTAKISQDFSTARQARLEQLEDGLAERFKKEREAFFELKASSLEPPLAKRALKKIPGYFKSLEVKRPPTERSWREILQKIEQYRSQAEKVAELELNLEETHSDPKSESGRNAQMLLLALADGVMQAFDESDVAPEDFTYLTLRQIRALYYALPPEKVPGFSEDDCLKPEGGSRYQLCMDDARYVYETKIRKHIEGWKDPESKRLGSFVYCPGCTRTDYRRKFSFVQLFEHIRAAHCTLLSSPWRLYVLKDEEILSGPNMFRWRAIPWPRNLPILAPHQRATGQWDPNQLKYERAPPKTELNVSPFEGRMVRPQTPKGEDVVENVIASLLEAAAAIRESTLAPPFKARIVWEYGMRSIRQGYNAKLVPRDLDKISAALIRAGEFTVFSKVGCVSCVDAQLLKPHKFAEMKHSFETIINHWKSEHQKPRNPATVETELLLLPSDAALAIELAKDGENAEATRAAFEYLFPPDNSSTEASKLASSLASAINSAKEATAKDDESVSSSSRRRRRSPVDALNVLAEQAAKIDPRLRDWSSSNGEGRRNERFEFGDPQPGRRHRLWLPTDSSRQTASSETNEAQNAEDENSESPESSSRIGGAPIATLLTSWSGEPRESSS